MTSLDLRDLVELHPNYTRGVTNEVEVDSYGKLILRISEIGYLGGFSRILPRGEKIPNNLKLITLRSPFRLKENSCLYIITPYRLKDDLDSVLFFANLGIQDYFPFATFPFSPPKAGEPICIPITTFGRSDIVRGSIIGTMEIILTVSGSSKEIYWDENVIPTSQEAEKTEEDLNSLADGLDEAVVKEETESDHVLENDKIDEYEEIDD